jgi:hypothetical protein
MVGNRPIFVKKRLFAISRPLKIKKAGFSTGRPFMGARFVKVNWEGNFDYLRHFYVRRRASNNLVFFCLAVQSGMAPIPALSLVDKTLKAILSTSPIPYACGCPCFFENDGGA